MNTISIPNLARRTVAEFLGTALLLATVVGSGIMAPLLFRWLVPGEMAVHEVPEGPLSLDSKESK